MLGYPHANSLKTLHILGEQQHLSFMGSSDFSTKALMNETGLTETQANQAKQRLTSEPLKDWIARKISFI